jgi:hypothetical protein
LSLAGKLLYDRAVYPRVWVKVVQRDPELPIRGRYLALRLVPDSGAPYFARLREQQVVFFVPEKTTEVETPRRLAADIWAEVTIPRTGLPRPIQLGTMQNGQMRPLDLN